jgi:hypothetical protein
MTVERSYLNCLAHASYLNGDEQTRTAAASTIGDQQHAEYALQPMSPDQFVARVTADQPDAPPSFTSDAVLNAKQTLDALLERVLTRLSLPNVLEMSSETDAQRLDVGEPAECAHGHMAGSINVGLSGQYATWAGTVRAHDRPIVIVATPGHEEEAACWPPASSRRPGRWHRSSTGNRVTTRSSFRRCRTMKQGEVPRRLTVAASLHRFVAPPK